LHTGEINNSGRFEKESSLFFLSPKGRGDDKPGNSYTLEPLAKVILKKLAILYVGAVAPTLPVWGRPGPPPWHFCKRLHQ